MWLATSSDIAPRRPKKSGQAKGCGWPPPQDGPRRVARFRVVAGHRREIAPQRPRIVARLGAAAGHRRKIAPRQPRRVARRNTGWPPPQDRPKTTEEGWSGSRSWLATAAREGGDNREENGRAGGS